MKMAAIDHKEAYLFWRKNNEKMMVKDMAKFFGVPDSTFSGIVSKQITKECEKRMKKRGK